MGNDRKNREYSTERCMAGSEMAGQCVQCGISHKMWSERDTKESKTEKVARIQT